MEEEHTKEPSHKNPEEATNYVKAVDTLLKMFVSDIHGFNCYACQDAYKNFLHTLSQLLSKLDSAYFTNMDTEVVLDTIPDKECAAFLERSEETADKVQQRVSSDSIPTGPEVTSKMHLHENITSFDKKGQEAVTRLFGHPQDAHNHMAQVAQAVVHLSKVSSPEQFTFVLQLAVRPIIQLKIPPHLSAPTELKFEKERLTQEEITEENCCNLILPRPFHPKLSGIAFKTPHEMLGCSSTLFNSKYPQLLVAKDFAVAEKKLHLTVSGRKYNPGKKAPKKRRTSDGKTAAPKPSTSQDQPQCESVSEQQPQSESITEQQPQGKTATDTQQKPVPSQFSSNDSLPDLFATTTKTFETKDPRSIPKKPKYSLRPKILHI